MEKIKALLKDKKGVSTTIAVLFGIVLFVAILLFAIGVFSAVNSYSTLNTFGEQLVQEAADAGKTSGDQVNERYEQLKDSTGLDPEVTWEANYYDASTGKVQYGDVITLHLELDTTLKMTQVPLHFTIEKTAKSQQYWK